MQITTINGQPTLLIDRTLTTADAAPPAEVTDGMATITTTHPHPHAPRRHTTRRDRLMAHTPRHRQRRRKPLLRSSTSATTANQPPTPKPAKTHDQRLQRHRKRHQHHHRARRQYTRLSAHRRPNKTRGLLGLPPLPSAATTIASADETDTPTTIALPEGVESTELSNLLAAHADDIVSQPTDSSNRSPIPTTEKEHV